MVQAKTAADGGYSLGALPAAEVKVIASRKPGLAAVLADSMVPPTVRSRSSARLKLAATEIRHGVDLVVPRGGFEIRGVVRNPDGAPLPGATVMVRPFY